MSNPFICTDHKFREDVGIPGVKRCHVCDYTVWPMRGDPYVGKYAACIECGATPPHHEDGCSYERVC